MGKTEPNVERAAERLLDDEALRGDLTDDAFGPLLSSVISLGVARAGRCESTDDLARAMRELLQGAVSAAASGRSEPLLAAARTPLVDAAEREALRSALAGLPSDPDEAAAKIGHAIAAATGVDPTAA